MSFFQSDIITVHYVVDGNFTAQHMNTKRPEGDIALSDGWGYGYMIEKWSISESYS